MQDQKTRVFACAVIKNDIGQFLLLKRVSNSRFAPNEWEFVSGTLDANETVEECIVREVKEETGLIATVLISMKSFEISDADGRWIVIPFQASTNGEAVKISDEHSDYKWYNKEEIEKLPYMESMKELWQ